MSRWLAIAALAVVYGASAASAIPDFNGYWSPVSKIATLRTSDGKAPPLNQAGKEIYEINKASATEGDRSFDNESKCLPIGMTRLMAESAFELLQTPGDVALIFEWNRHVHIAPVRAAHLQQYAYPFYLGNSIAYIRGAALVIDSVYFNDQTLLDRSGLPHSDQLKVQQQLTLKGTNTLQNLMTITDPGMYSKPWTTTLTYRRLPAGERIGEDYCAERMGLKQAGR
jgi:hypothetical protein